MTTAAATLNRASLADWYRRNRERSRQLFDIVRPEAYYSRPISLRHPIVFYEGHLPAFSVNTLVKKGLGRPGVDEGLERLFARGIDPEDEASASPQSARHEWPTREEVGRFAGECDALILDALANAAAGSTRASAVCTRAQAVFAILEHEAMHQETMLYMWHQLPYNRSGPRRMRALTRAARARRSPRVTVPAGRATPWRPAQARFPWLGQRVPGLGVDVPAFEIDVHNVTNEQFMDFVAAGGYRQPELVDAVGPFRNGFVHDGIEHPVLLVAARREKWQWRDMFEAIDAATRVAGLRQPGGGRRIRALGRAHACPPKPSTTEPPSATPYRESSGSIRGARRLPMLSRGLFDFASWEPVAAGRHPRGESAWGVARPDGQRMGVDIQERLRRSTDSARWPSIRSIRRTSSTVNTGDEGGVAGHGRRVAAPQLPQLVPPELTRTSMPRSAACGPTSNR